MGLEPITLLVGLKCLQCPFITKKSISSLHKLGNLRLNGCFIAQNNVLSYSFTKVSSKLAQLFSRLYSSLILNLRTLMGSHINCATLQFALWIVWIKPFRQFERHFQHCSFLFQLPWLVTEANIAHWEIFLFFCSQSKELFRISLILMPKLTNFVSHLKTL